ncbi:hypothetical protein XAPC_464 [Xanthomonas citri pv. punicae str. LMG 859]|nr:hypothetical protein XAPC_464 [Xanthomonas citri pv. punicae str. LMG 859]
MMPEQSCACLCALPAACGTIGAVDAANALMDGFTVHAKGLAHRTLDPEKSHPRTGASPAM